MTGSPRRSEGEVRTQGIKRQGRPRQAARQAKAGRPGQGRPRQAAQGAMQGRRQGGKAGSGHRRGRHQGKGRQRRSRFAASQGRLLDPAELPPPHRAALVGGGLAPPT